MNRAEHARIVLPCRAPDPDSLRLERERLLERKLLGNAQIRQRVESLGGDLSEAAISEKRRHLAASLRVTPSISPRLHATFTAATRILFLERPAELYVEASAQLNAFCLTLPDDSICVVVTSALVERLSQRELLFILGHELGHAILGHHAIPVGAILRGAGESDRLPWPLVMQLLSWSRCCEVSADRYGLICCQDPRLARRAFLKLASGLSDAHLADGGDFHEQTEAWEEGRSEADGAQYTHPLLPIRVLCAHTFAESRHLTELFSHLDDPPRWSVEEADGHAARELCRMDPDPELLEDDAQSRLHKRILALAGLCMVMGDGENRPEEVEGLIGLVGHEALADALQCLSVEGGSSFVARVLREAGEAAGAFGLDERLRLVGCLLVIAVLDSNLHEVELAFVYQFAKCFIVPEIFVDAAIARIASGGNPLG